MYMDDIKQFAKNEKELETLILAVRIYSKNIGMEYGIEKCIVLIMKSGKLHMTEGIEQSKWNQNAQRKRNQQILRNTWSGHHQTYWNEKKNKKEYHRRTRKLLESKVNSRNFIKRINTILKVDERRTSATGPENKKNRLYMPRKEGGRGIGGIQDSVHSSRQILEDYIKKGQRKTEATRNNTDNTSIDRTKITRKQKWKIKSQTKSHTRKLGHG